MSGQGQRRGEYQDRQREGGGGGGRQGGGGDGYYRRDDRGAGGSGSTGSHSGGGGGYRRDDRSGDRGGGRGGGSYQGRGGGGGYRGGGGGGRSQTTISDAAFDLPQPVTAVILNEAKMGWNAVKHDSRQNPVPPICKGPGDLAPNKISLTTNNLPLRRLVLPEKIFLYDIDVDLSPEDKIEKSKRKKKPTAAGGARKRPLPSDPETPPPVGDKDPPKPKLWKKIVKALLPILQNDNGKKYFATDFMKNIYAPFELRLSSEYRIPLSSIDDEGNSETVYICRVTRAGQPIPTAQLQTCVDDMYDYYVKKKNSVSEHLINVERVLNIALKTTLNLSLTPVGRFSFYATPSDERQNLDLTGGLVNWTGFSTLLSMGWKTFVNVDIANTAFVKGQYVFDALDSLSGRGGGGGGNRGRGGYRGGGRGGGGYGGDRPSCNPEDAQSYGPEDVRKALKLLKGVLVEYPIRAGKLSGRITDIFNNSPRENVFTDSNGRETNVERYFAENYGIRLQHPRGLCLQLRGRSVVPAEICTIRKGQAYNAKLNEAQTAAMIRETAIDPAKRLGQIKNHVASIKLAQDPVLQNFGVTVSDTLHKVDARVLAPPTLVYGSNQGQKWITPPRDGVWNMFQQPLKFITAAPKFNWGVINVDGGVHKDEVFEFVHKMCRVSGPTGLQLSDAETAMRNYTAIRGRMELKPTLIKYIEAGLRMVLVIVPRKDKDMYGTIKMQSEISLTGKKVILTQVVQTRTLRKGDDATIQNILYKINMKMGGTNYLMHANSTGRRELGPWTKIDLLRAPVLVMGADVTHPGMESKFPSLAAVTASIDRTGMPYQTYIQAQRRADKDAAEVITGLAVIVKQFIETFIENTGYKPRKIIYYRDGVGDGQFGEVLSTEMMEIRRGCELAAQMPNFYANCKGDTALGEKSLTGGYKPKITFLAVQKRHKVRFFPNNPADGVGRMQNAPPGTVVDTDIVKPTITDFYLLSHTGIQGTSRPTRYQVLWDDSDLSTNELQLLSYYLCYMYCRCTRSVSYPAPTYYAHLAATRAKAYAEMLPDDTLGNIARVNSSIQRNPDFQRQFRMHFV